LSGPANPSKDLVELDTIAVKEPPLAILKAIQYELAQDSDGARQGLGIADEAVFGLMGFLIAFTFSGAASRVDTRRHLVVEEANAIGTAYLRLDLLRASAQPALRESMK
jgi:hypothetical protein